MPKTNHHRNGRALLLGSLLAFAFGSHELCAQDARPTAFVNARILTISGAPIERGTLVVRNGKIVAVGADVASPAGARIVDCEGGTLMPGLVSAHSRAGFTTPPSMPTADAGARRGGRRGQGAPPPDTGGRGAQNSAATKVAERLDPKQEVFAELLRAGITTLALTPTGDAFPGFGAVLAPDGTTLDTLVKDDDAFLFVGMQRDTRVKKTLKDGFEAAKKVVEARKAPKDPPKPDAAGDKPSGDQKPADAPKQGEPQKPQEPPKPDQPKPDQPKPDQPKPEPPKPDQPKPDQPKPDQPKPAEQKPAGDKPAEDKPAAKPEEKKDPNIEVLADLLEGKHKAIVQINSASDLLHWIHACGKDLAFSRTICTESFDQQAGTFDLVLDDLKAMKAAVLVPPDLNVRPRSRYLENPVRALHEAGIEVGFVLGDTPARVRMLFFRAMELIRGGLPRDVALRAMTIVPSKALGLEAQVGTLETGKKANLLLFSGDPLDPTSELRSVWLEGRKIDTDKKAR